MSLLQNSNAISTAGGYDVNNSLRFRGSASAYLSRTPGSAGTRTKGTISFWVKRGSISATTQQTMFSAGDGGVTNFAAVSFDTTASDLNWYFKNVSAQLITTQVFRDPSAWYHIVLAWDTTQATSSDRMKMYVNGTQITSFSTATYPALNSTPVYFNNIVHTIGTQYYNSSYSGVYFDGYMAEVHGIDGQALTPSSFGATDTDTGVWKPKAYSGTYGTNGYYLKFSDIATTSGSNAGLGKDFSGNTNYWTTNNISVTSGTTYDAMTDSPTNTSATVANYATFSGTNLGTYANATITEAGLKVSVSAGGTPDGGKAYAPFGMSDGSGKWYFEMTCVDPGSTNQRLCFGVANVTTNPNAVAITNGYYASASGAHGNYNIGTFTTNDVLQVAYDATTNKLWFGKNNTWYNSGNPVTGANPTATVTSGITYVPFSTYASSGGGPGIGAWNFGQRPFAYTPPTGYVALNTYNLPDSTIKKGNSYMDAVTYSGSNSSQTVTNAGSFQPDLVWAKSRSGAYNNILVDAIRGGNLYLVSNSTAADATSSGLATFTSSGITWTGGASGVNASGDTYVDWMWKGGNGTSSNTQGSITSTVSVNTTAGFSIVTYTGVGSSPKTVGHGLGVAPKMILLKSRGASVNWYVWHTSLGATQVIEGLNTTGAASSQITFNNTLPTSSVISLGNNDSNNNGSTYVLYVWAEIAGFSKFGSYTGNGSADGPFVYLGFRPKFIMLKSTTTAGSNWWATDTSRSTYNAANALLFPNLSNAEYTTAGVETDILSNGFKLRTTNGDGNKSGDTFIYMAFSESPFKNSLAR